MSIWQKYFENAYVGCFHYLVNRRLHWTERIFWLIVILSSCGGTYYVISRTLFEYRQQKPMYKVDTNYLDWSVAFPSVVICERKFSRMSTKIKRTVDKLIESYGFNKSVIDDDLRARTSEFAFLRPSDISPLKDYCTKKPCPTGNFSIVMDQLRGKCTDLFSFCRYNDEVFNCCEEFLPVETSFGECFAFNNFAGRYQDGKRVKRLKWNIVREPGRTQGTLYIEFKYKLLIINVVSPSEVPHVRNEQTIFKQTQATTLTDGFEYYYRVNLQPTVTFDDQKFVPIESRGCRFPSENNLHYFDFYSEANCLLECFMKAQKDACGCILHTYPRTASSDFCNLSNIFCTAAVTDTADCNCVPDCNSTIIRKVGSTERNSKGSFLSKDTTISLKMDVPAPSLRYIRYSLKSELNLIVSIGGAVGFLLGSSFLSLAQIFYYLLVYPLTNYFSIKVVQNRKEKQEKLEENFRIGRMKLKLEKIEKDIHKGMMVKIEKSSFKI